jgi:hypothetical protein
MEVSRVQVRHVVIVHFVALRCESKVVAPRPVICLVALARRAAARHSPRALDTVPLDPIIAIPAQVRTRQEDVSQLPLRLDFVECRC